MKKNVPIKEYDLAVRNKAKNHITELVWYDNLCLSKEVGSISDKIKEQYANWGGEFDLETSNEILENLGNIIMHCTSMVHSLNSQYSLQKIIDNNFNKIS